MGDDDNQISTILQIVIRQKMEIDSICAELEFLTSVIKQDSNNTVCQTLLDIETAKLKANKIAFETLLDVLKKDYGNTLKRLINNCAEPELKSHIINLLVEINNYKNNIDVDIIDLLEKTITLVEKRTQGAKETQPSINLDNNFKNNYHNLVERVNGKPNGAKKIAGIALIILGICTLPLTPVGIACIVGGSLLFNQGRRHGFSKAAYQLEQRFFSAPEPKPDQPQYTQASPQPHGQ